MDTGKGKQAFEALTAAVMTRGNEPGSQTSLDAEQRSIVIRFAEVNIWRRPKPGDCPNRLALGRLQALYVARALATLDGPGAIVPFVNLELREVFVAQQKFMAAVLEQESVPGSPGAGLAQSS